MPIERPRTEIEIIFELLNTCDRPDYLTQNVVFLSGERVLNPVSGNMYLRAMIEAGVLESEEKDWRGMTVLRVRISPKGRELLDRSREAMDQYRAVLDMLAIVRRGD